MLRSIFERIGIWVGIPLTIGGVFSYYFRYDLISVAIIVALVMWGFRTELRIQDLQKKVFGGKRNG